MASLQESSGKAAAGMVFCLDRLRDLRGIAEGCPLSGEERREIAETAGVLRPPAKRAPRAECEEVRELRRGVRRTFEGTAFSRFPLDAGH